MNKVDNLQYDDQANLQYDDQAKSIQFHFKNLFQEVEAEIEKFGDSENKTLAMKALEVAYMWIGKTIRDEQIERNNGAILEEQRSNS
jgi:hypothetical protein